MVNLNDYKTDDNPEVTIFNNGEAGRVKNVRIEVAKKKPEDHQNAPDYKLNFIDDEGGAVNDGIYYPKEDDGERRIQINLSRLVSILHAVNPASKEKLLPEFKDYVTAVDFLIKQIAESSRKGRVNVFACYGTVNRPSDYLRIRKFNFVEAVTTDDSTTRLKAKLSTDPSKREWDDVMTRLKPTTFSDSEEDGSSTDDVDIDDWLV